jgi:oxygen-independent coproporphyrinogen-3 oxidase
MSGFGIYVHWPYCARVCPYCDFNVYRARGGDHAPLLEAIIADIEAFARRFGKRQASSIFFGGGTPSLLSAAELARIIEAANAYLGLAADCEITLEANPEDAARFAEHAAAGVNRFSLGVQALDNAALKALGRAHDVTTSLNAIDAAAATQQRVSVDLIYAREGQSEAAWEAELREALALPVEHLSLYQLSIEPRTAFARRAARGDLNPPSNDAAAALYELTQSLCEEGGFHGYEISNHARTDAARSRHNMLYWKSEDWIGVGPGAHGRFDHNGARIATEAQRQPADYIDAVREHGLGWIDEATLEPSEAADEMLLMGLRIREGVNLHALENLRGAPINQDALQWLADEGLVASANDRLTLTALGRPLADRIVLELSA